MTQIFYLSFCDSTKPKGQQFLGAAVVDVTDADMLTALPKLREIRALNGAVPPNDGDEASWLAGAIQNAHLAGCNPGGEVASVRVDLAPEFIIHGYRYPRNRLLSKADIEAIDRAIESPLPSPPVSA